jgi:hypothetical protein
MCLPVKSGGLVVDNIYFINRLIPTAFTREKLCIPHNFSNQIIEFFLRQCVMLCRGTFFWFNRGYYKLNKVRQKKQGSGIIEGIIFIYLFKKTY